MIDIDGQFRERLESIDETALKSSFDEQDCLLLVEDFVPKPVLERLVGDLAGVRGAVHRNYVPGQKKGGAVSRRSLDRLAPAFGQVYGSPQLWRFVEGLTGETLKPCRPADQHTYALYFYTEPGDHIGWHYDTSFYRGRRFTMLFCLAGNSTTKLECSLYHRDRDRDDVACAFALEPGTMVLFDGDRLWHRATPLQAGDGERILLTMEFVTDPTMSPVRHLISNIKDASAYFGFREVFLGLGERGDRSRALDPSVPGYAAPWFTFRLLSRAFERLHPAARRSQPCPASAPIGRDPSPAASEPD
ncbi:MAG: 2OG-Fe(II) oxygenase [Deltaproteobacteria bacterium]|nr:2OG-Fe(II) oxygenase [Deltaproteobacteria bacterium]